MTGPGTSTRGALLDMQVATATELVEVLRDETRALVDAEAMALAELSRRKDRLARRLEELAIQARQAEAGAETARAATRLHELLRECRDLNASNGRLIHDGERRTRLALEILGRPQQTEVYAASGARETGVRAQEFGKA